MKCILIISLRAKRRGHPFTWLLCMTLHVWQNTFHKNFTRDWASRLRKGKQTTRCINLITDCWQNRHFAVKFSAADMREMSLCDKWQQFFWCQSSKEFLSHHPQQLGASASLQFCLFSLSVSLSLCLSVYLKPDYTERCSQVFFVFDPSTKNILHKTKLNPILCKNNFFIYCWPKYLFSEFLLKSDEFEREKEKKIGYDDVWILFK